jgi:hypothetical protein
VHAIRARGYPHAAVLPRDGRPRWLAARETIERVKLRALQRLRGELNVDRLVAQGLEVGRGTFVARNVYLDPGHPWLITIGDNSGLSPGVIVMVHDASMKRLAGYTRIARVVIRRSCLRRRGGDHPPRLEDRRRLDRRRGRGRAWRCPPGLTGHRQPRQGRVGRCVRGRMPPASRFAGSRLATRGVDRWARHHRCA